MAVVSYKCPNCGGGLVFRPELQKSKCDFCLSEFTDEQLQRITEKLAARAGTAGRLVAYVCNSCGAEVVTEDTTAATFCYYCHNPVLLADRLSGEFKPDKIIPFTYEREKAVTSFLNWARSKRFVPKEFTSASQLEKITGIYVPYWVADFRADVNYCGKGVRRRIWVTGNTEHTEVQEFAFERQGPIDVGAIAEIAMRKLEKELLESIGPYDEAAAVDFSMSYLSGFFAEKYAIDQAEAEPVLTDRATQYATALVRESIGNYDQVTYTNSDLDISEVHWRYILKPVWVLTYRYKGKTYVYAVNGQNGKAFGELPVDGKKLGLSSGLLAASVFVLSILGGLWLW